GRFDEQAHALWVAQRVSLENGREPFVVEAGALSRLFELRLLNDIDCIDTQRRVWVEEEGLRARAGNAPSRQTLHLLQHRSDFGGHQNLNNALGCDNVVPVANLASTVECIEPSRGSALEAGFNFDDSIICDGF